MLIDEDVEALKCLGLSEREAKIYLSLLFSGPSSIRMISKISTVARQDAYRVINALYEKGLVEKIISLPATLKAIPIKNALDTLIESKAAEIDSAFSRRNALLEKFGDQETQALYEEPQFMLIAGKGKIMHNTRERHEHAKESIDFAGSWEAFLTYYYSVKESVQKAKENNVKIRIIISKPEKSQILYKIERFLKEFPNMQLKYASPEPFLISIHDKKICTFSILSARFDIFSVSILRSTNTSFIQLLQNYFDNLWNKLP